MHLPLTHWSDSEKPHPSLNFFFLRENPIFETNKNDCEQQGENVDVSLMGAVRHMGSARLTAPAGSRQQY